MQINHLAIEVRPRNPWEAMDLGMRMALSWWKPVYGAWLAAYLPLIAIITLLSAQLNAPYLAWGLVWWLKPLLERVPLYVLSHAVFGETPRVSDALRAIPSLLRTAPLWRMLLTRFSLSRSCCLPVVMLEGLPGKERRTRFRVLLKGMANSAVWLTIVCVHLELVVMAGLYALLELFLPRTLDPQLGLEELFTFGAPDWTIWLFYGISVFSYLVIGPLYVASGFSLYLNRRTILEGWDIELGFRRMAQRLAQPKSLARAALLLLCLSGFAASFPNEALAVPRNAEAQRHIDEVMQQPEFNTKKTVESWRYIGEKEEEEKARPNSAWRQILSILGGGLAWIFKGLLYLLLFALVVWLILNHQRWLNWMRGVRPSPAYRPPAQLFGLDIRPESLPPNLAEAALQLWQAGDARAALSLLYRGALSRLAQHEQVTLKISDTEGDCLHEVQRTQVQTTSAYFAHLTQAWQTVAYAGRAPLSAEGEALCREFTEHFGGGR